MGEEPVEILFIGPADRDPSFSRKGEGFGVDLNLNFLFCLMYHLQQILRTAGFTR